MSANIRDKKHGMTNVGKNINYGNIKVFAPDGKQLFYSDHKKAKWYLDRDLANIIGENSIQLTFEPKGDGNWGKYGEFPIENRCVVCGTTDELTRHHIVPHSYRKHLPDEYKNHNFHDVALVCIEHHHQYEREFADAFKVSLIDKYDLDIDQSPSKESDRINTKLRSISNALLKYKSFINIERIISMENEIKQFLNKDVIDNNDIEYVYNLSSSKTHYNTLESDIIMKWKEKLESINIDEFIVMWRQHFIDSMKPKYMPKGWNINYKR
jgi:hypothetical protein